MQLRMKRFADGGRQFWGRISVVKEDCFFQTIEVGIASWASVNMPFDGTAFGRSKLHVEVVTHVSKNINTSGAFGSHDVM